MNEEKSAEKSAEKPVDRGAAGKPGGRKPDRRRAWLRGGIVALAIVVGLVAWLATRDSGSDSSASAEPAEPRIVNETELREAAADLGQPIYWAGPIAGKELELRELGEGGGAQVLYLPEGTAAGDGSANSVTIGSYPLPDPEAALKGFAERPGAIVRYSKDARELVSSAESPTSVYFTSADNSVQVEVFAPTAGRAMGLAQSGRVEPIG